MKNIFFSLLIIFPALGFSQAPNLMSYQTVVWDTGNNLVISLPVGFQFSILQGSTTGTAVYVETHNVSTNANGLATLEIGNGTLVSGDIATIDWSNGPYFFKTETDPTGGTTYTITGTNQFLSVPYALYANVADSVVNDMVDDADADPTNELNTAATLVGTNLNITDGGGTLTVDLSTMVDADPDPSNEIQTISMVGNDLTLSTGGGSVTVPTSLDDDPTNEFQDLSFSNDTVYISDGTETYVGPENVIAPTLIAPAGNFGLPFSDAGFYKQNDRVYLQGALSATSNPGDVLFVLPIGYRPAKRVLLPSLVTGQAGSIVVFANGDVVFQSGPASGSVVMDGLSFRITN